MRHSRLISAVLLTVSWGSFIGSLLWAMSVLCECGIDDYLYRDSEILFFLLGILFWGLSCFFVGMRCFLQFHRLHRVIGDGVVSTGKPKVEKITAKSPYIAFAILLSIFCLIAVFKVNNLSVSPAMYFVRLPEHKYGEVWNADKFSRNESRLYEEHPDAFVVQLSPLTKDDALSAILRFVVRWPADYDYKAELVDGVTFRRNRDQLLLEYPNVEVFKVI